MAQGEGCIHGQAAHRAARHEAAEDAGRRILGMPVVGRCHREGILGPGGRGGRGGECGRRAQPPGEGDLRAHRHREVVVPQDFGCHRAARWDASSKRPDPSPSLCTRSDGCLLDVDAHIAVERHGQGVESRPEVGRRRRGPGAHGGEARRSEKR